VAVDRAPRVRWTARVPDYDAFGREIGEDPLASLRSATNPAPAREEPAARPEPAREAVEAPAGDREEAPAADAFGAPAGDRAEAPSGDRVEADLAAWSGARSPDVAPPDDVPLGSPSRIEFVRPQRRRRSGLAGLLVLVAVLGGLGLAANAVVEKGGEIIDQISVPEEAAPAPTGLQTGSWLRAENLRNALITLKGADLGRPVLLRIAPDRIDATLIKGDQLHVVQINSAGELNELGSSAGSGRAISFNAIDPAAPEKLVRRGADGEHPASSIDYVLVNPGPPPNVAAYFKRNRIVIGDRHGRPQRVI
jgi:hypothetical protein